MSPFHQRPVHRLPEETVRASCLVLVITAGLAASYAAESPTGSISPVVRFSADERAVMIEYGEHHWDFVRPVVSAWSYQPTGKVYWVAPDGADTDGGVPSRPYRTIGKPASGCRGKAASLDQPHHEKLSDLGAFPNHAQ